MWHWETICKRRFTYSLTNFPLHSIVFLVSTPWIAQTGETNVEVKSSLRLQVVVVCRRIKIGLLVKVGAQHNRNHLGNCV